MPFDFTTERMKNYITLLLLLFVGNIFSQEVSVTKINGTVLNAKTKLPMQGVTVINLNLVKGTVTNAIGSFELEARVNDTLHISYVGFDPLKVRVSSDWIKTRITTIELVEKAIVLDEVEIDGVTLTGYLEVDAKIIPKGENFRYSIAGLSQGYEAGKRSSSAFSKVMSSVFNPADLLYNVFGKKPREFRKLREMKKDETVKNVLASKYDRETLAALLGITKKDIEEILTHCSYSESFIKTANDLQIMDAISECYEEYKLMNRNK